MSLPLAGIRIVELAAKGPGPFGVMLLADLGAEVVRVDRPGDQGGDTLAGTGRGRRSVVADLKTEAGTQAVLELVDGSDVLVEGNRPGVAERLGLGPDVCCARNPRLVYARMTGWGQDGPLAHEPGHDINFLAVAGALFPLGDADRPPPPPLNLVGDFGGGGTFLAIGVLAALWERTRTGRGRVLDVAMVDGIGSLLTAYHHLRGAGHWTDGRGANLVDGGAPFYRTYETLDGRYVAVGCLDPRGWRSLLVGLALDDWPQHDTGRWPEQRAAIAAVFATATRDEWAERFAGSDACVSPVLTLAEAPCHPHALARGSLPIQNGVVTPAPAPRF